MMRSISWKRRIQNTLFFGIVVLPLCSCYPIYRNVQLDDNPETSGRNAAELRIHKDATRLNSIDGKDVKFTAYDVFDALKVKLAPGVHAIDVSYYYPHRKTGAAGISGHTQLSRDSHKLSFTAAADHIYVVRTPLVKLRGYVNWCPVMMSMMAGCSSEVATDQWQTSVVDITDQNNELVVVLSNKPE